MEPNEVIQLTDVHDNIRALIEERKLLQQRIVEIDAKFEIIRGALPAQPRKRRKATGTIEHTKAKVGKIAGKEVA